MPEVQSNRKLMANRANAQKSTGPRTPEGKARCAQNAVRHGIFAKDLVIPGKQHLETQEDFDALHAGLREAMQPRDPLEETLVLRVAVANWRTRRALRFEAASIRQSLDAAAAAPPPDPQLARLDSAISSAQIGVHWATKRLAYAKTSPPR